jgi:integrase
MDLAHNGEGEIDVLLDGFSDERARAAVLKAYYTFAHGDPSTFPAQFALLLQAHSKALRAGPQALSRADIEELIRALETHNQAVLGAVQNCAKQTRRLEKIVLYGLPIAAIASAMLAGAVRWLIDLAILHLG